MKRSHWLLVVIGLGIVGSAGYWFGLRQGADFGLAFASGLSGSSSLMYLRAIQDAKINFYTDVMETDVDTALIINHDIEERPAFRLSALLWEAEAEAGRRASLTRLADYRKAHPSPQRPEALDALFAQVPESQRKNLPEITPQMRQSMLKTQETIAEMVARYASKSP
jgi:hypothetical protein